MTKQYYARWDWEQDRPVRQLDDSLSLPRTHAVIFRDAWNRVYRVEVHNPDDIIVHDVEGELREEVFLYDYFHDDFDRILEKRSIDENGVVSLIVRYDYEDAGKTIHERAWSPGQEVPPQERRRSVTVT